MAAIVRAWCAVLDIGHSDPSNYSESVSCSIVAEWVIIDPQRCSEAWIDGLNLLRAAILRARNRDV